MLRIWRSFLVAVWAVALVHFLKDITQDILHIPTFLDMLGNIQEDISWLPKYLQWLVYGAGIGSFLAEIVLLIAIPIVKKGERFSRLEGWIVGIIVFMLIYFLVVIILDPRFG